MVTKKIKGRGRPPGRTVRGERTKARLYAVATQLFAERGYESTTLRAIATEAGVSPTLLYKHFPSKLAVVLQLYDELSHTFEGKAHELPVGGWQGNSIATLRTSLEVLHPHREVLRALIPVLVADPDNGLFSPANAASGERVKACFLAAVTEADDAPEHELAEAIGRLLYLLQLAVILWWLLDRSEGQWTTAQLVALLEQVSGLLKPMLPLASGPILQLDRLASAGLMGSSHG